MSWKLLWPQWVSTWTGRGLGLTDALLGCRKCKASRPTVPSKQPIINCSFPAHRALPRSVRLGLPIAFSLFLADALKFPQPSFFHASSAAMRVLACLLACLLACSLRAHTHTLAHTSLCSSSDSLFSSSDVPPLLHEDQMQTKLAETVPGAASRAVQVASSVELVLRGPGRRS